MKGGADVEGTSSFRLPGKSDHEDNVVTRVCLAVDPQIKLNESKLKC